MLTITRRSLPALAFGTALAPKARADEQKFRLRCSLDTSATHGRTVYVGDYLKRLEEASGGRIETQLFHSGQLYRDRDVGKALRQGAVEMAAPGTWELTGFVPDTDAVWMPMFFGLDYDKMHSLIDGPIGKMISDEVEKALNVKVIGPWFDLGYANFYTLKKPIKTGDDLKGLKIRVAGGVGQFAHVRYYGALPDMTAWPDVPLALSQGLFDGLSTTDESFASSKLWDAGGKYAFSSHENLGEYVPVVTQRFWNSLPPDLQKLVVDVWAQNNPIYREKMRERQLNARKEMEAHGVVFVDPSPEELARIRAGMMAQVDDWAQQMKISPPLLELLKKLA